MLGDFDTAGRVHFFEHLKRLDPWKDHPALADGSDFDWLIPLSIHADGAQFYRDDENFVYSFGSVFGSKGPLKDILLTKFPIAIIPERFMQDHQVSWAL